MSTKYVLTLLGALVAGAAAATAWQRLVVEDGDVSAAPRAASRRAEAPTDAAMQGMLRREFARVRADIGDLKATQAAVSTHSANGVAVDEPAVDPEVEERRLAAHAATSELLRSRLAAKRWSREDEAQWRHTTVDLAPDQYAELRNKLNAAINAGEVDASDFFRTD